MDSSSLKKKANNDINENPNNYIINNFESKKSTKGEL